MKRVSTTSIVLAPTDTGAVGKAWDEVSASFDRFCLAAGVDALGAMMEKDAERLGAAVTTADQRDARSHRENPWRSCAPHVTARQPAAAVVRPMRWLRGSPAGSRGLVRHHGNASVASAEN